jgi:signal peptidase I
MMARRRKQLDVSELIITFILIVFIIGALSYLFTPVLYCKHYTAEGDPHSESETSIEFAEELFEQKDGVFVNVRGTSMLPTIECGDQCFCEPADEYGVGDIIMFRVMYHGRELLVAHRIVQTTTGGDFKTKGDNNDYLDPWIVPERNIYCKVPYVPRIQSMLVRW